MHTHTHTPYIFTHTYAYAHMFIHTHTSCYELGILTEVIAIISHKQASQFPKDQPEHVENQIMRQKWSNKNDVTHLNNE